MIIRTACFLHFPSKNFIIIVIIWAKTMLFHREETSLAECPGQCALEGIYFVTLRTASTSKYLSGRCVRPLYPRKNLLLL